MSIARSRMPRIPCEDEPLVRIEAAPVVTNGQHRGVSVALKA